MDAVVELADNAGAPTEASGSGWVWREKRPSEPTRRFPAARLLQSDIPRPAGTSPHPRRWGEELRGILSEHDRALPGIHAV